MGAFIWEVENEGAEEVEVSIMFTFQNGTETKEDRRGGHWNEPFSVEKGGSCVRGVMLHHVTPANPYTLAISAREKVGPPETPQGLETVHGSSWDRSLPWSSGLSLAGWQRGFLEHQQCPIVASLPHLYLQGPRGASGF